MSMDNFKYRMLSNGYEQDNFFMPSDNVWNGVADELDGKPNRRKLFVIFFSSFICLPALIILLFPKMDFENNSSSTKIQLQNSKLIEIQESNKSTKAIDGATQQNDLAEKKGKIINNAVQSSSLTSVPKKLVNTDINTQSIINGEGQYHSDSRPKVDLRLTESARFSLLSPNAKINSLEETAGFQFQNNRDAAQSAMNTADKVDVELSPEISNNFIQIQKIPIASSPLYTNVSILEKQPMIVEIQKASVSQDWIIALNAYSSISNYSISNYSGFDQIDFSLKGKASFGYQFIAEKNIAHNMSLYAGIGLDHAHFDANYLLTIDGNELVFASIEQQGSPAKLSKTIPSLAGGLESTFIFNNISSKLEQAVVDLSLAHNFKTIIFPVGARFSFVNSTKLKTSLAVGIEYSKRLLTIDTGINTLMAQEGTVELGSVVAVERDDQPFTIHNVNASALLAVDYQLTDRMAVGVQSGLIKPLSNVYQDANYTVNTYQLRGGISLKYALSNIKN